MRKVFLFVIFIRFLSDLQSQNFEIGFNPGFGKTYGIQEVFLSSSNIGVNKYLMGLNAAYLIPNSNFVHNMGIYYQINNKNSLSVNFLQIPIGFELDQGKMVQAILGAGWILSYLTNYSSEVVDDFKNHHTDFQLGGYLDLGLRIHFSEFFNVLVKGRLESFFTPVYKESIPYHFGNTSFSNHLASGFLVMAGVNYAIKRKK